MTKSKVNIFIGVATVALVVFIVTMANIAHRKGSSSTATKDGTAKLLFSDEFNGSSLNKNKWNTCYAWFNASYQGCTNSSNNELEWYKPSQVSVSGGSAHLEAVKQTVEGQNSNTGSVASYPYVSGMISTGKLSTKAMPKWAGSYGYYVMRAKLPTGEGMWPAFWLLPVSGKWPPEIDIMEMLGNSPNQILMTYFWPNGSYPPPKDTSTYTGTDFSNGWHTYAINWQKNSITWYIDGTVEKKVTGIHVPNTQMQIIANLAVGGNLPGDPSASTKFPQTMSIDYIRVYNTKP